MNPHPLRGRCGRLQGCVVCYWLGGWRDNPLFEAASSTPARTVRVLTPEERTQAYGEPHRPA